MQIKEGPIRYPLGEEHSVFIPDDILPIANPRQSRYTQPVDLILPGLPKLSINYIATRSIYGFDISCVIPTSNLVAANLISVKSKPDGNIKHAQYTNHKFEWLFGFVRNKIITPSGTYEGTLHWNITDASNALRYIYLPTDQTKQPISPTFPISNEQLFSLTGNFVEPNNS